MNILSQRKGMIRIYEKRRGYDAVLFTLLLVVYTAVTLYLFIAQCYPERDYNSDMAAYVNKVAGIEGDYNFPYPLFFTVAKFFALFSDASMGTAIATAFLNVLSILAVKYYMDRAVYKWDYFKSVRTAKEGITASEDKSAFKGMLVTFMVFALFLVSNIYSPKNTAFFGFDYTYRILGAYTPNPIWNATYMATRPFTIVCFVEGCYMLELIKNRSFQWKKALPFAVSLFLTTMTKPSYTMVILPTIAILLLTELIRTKGKSFSDSFVFCLTMIPTGVALLYQYAGVFTGTNIKGEETGIAFGIAKVWGYYSSNIPLSIIMGLALPIGVLVLNFGELKKNAYYRFALLNYAVAAIMFLCLYEKGFRMLHANFSWGYMHAQFFMFMMTLVYVIKNTLEWRKSYKIVFVISEWIVLFYHLICGINFLIFNLQGNYLLGF
jgi:hypothetical protein